MEQGGYTNKMQDWTTIGFLFAFLSALGVAVDRFLLKRYKIAFHLLLLKWWDNLDNTSIIDLPKLMAIQSLQILRVIFGPKPFSLRVIIIVSIYTYFLTSIFYVIGMKMDGTWEHLLQATPIPLPIFTVYFSNIPFDLLTSVVTIFALIVISKGRTLSQIVLIVGDIVIATILAIVCFATIVWSSDIYQTTQLPFASEMREHNRLIDRNYHYQKLKKDLTKDGFSSNVDLLNQPHSAYKQYIMGAYYSYVSIITNQPYKTISTVKAIEEKKEKVYYYLDYRNAAVTPILISATTLIPTVAWMIFLFIMIISKIVLLVWKIITMYYLELATEPDVNENPLSFMPTTLLGVTFGVIAAFLKVVIDFLK